MDEIWAKHKPKHPTPPLGIIGNRITVVRDLYLYYFLFKTRKWHSCARRLSHRTEVGMVRFHRLRAEDDTDPLTVAAAKAGLKAAKKRPQPGRCFTCGQCHRERKRGRWGSPFHHRSRHMPMLVATLKRASRIFQTAWRQLQSHKILCWLLY